jgi:hypothetical protein
MKFEGRRMNGAARAAPDGRISSGCMFIEERFMGSVLTFEHDLPLRFAKHFCGSGF